MRGQLLFLAVNMQSVICYSPVLAETQPAAKWPWLRLRPLEKRGKIPHILLAKIWTRPYSFAPASIPNIFNPHPLLNKSIFFRGEKKNHIAASPSLSSERCFPGRWISICRLPNLKQLWKYKVHLYQWAIYIYTSRFPVSLTGTLN